MLEALGGRSGWLFLVGSPARWLRGIVACGLAQEALERRQGPLSWPRGEPPPKPAPLEPGPVTPGTSSLMGDMRLECARCERIKLGNDPKGLDHIPSCSFRGTGKDPEL